MTDRRALALAGLERDAIARAVGGDDDRPVDRRSRSAFAQQRGQPLRPRPSAARSCRARGARRLRSRLATRSCAICCASVVRRSAPRRPSRAAIVIAGSVAGSESPRPPAGSDARRDAREHDQRPRSRRRRERERPRSAAASKGGQLNARRGERTRRAGAPAQTIVSAPSTATLVANSVVRRDQERREQRDRDARRRGAQPPVGIVFGSVIMKKRKTRISGEKTSTRQKSQSDDRAEVPARGHRVPARGEHADRRGEREPEADREPEQVQAPEDREPAADDDRERQRQPRRHRPPPEVERLRERGAEQRGSRATSPKFDGLKMCAAAASGSGTSRAATTAAVPAKIHQPCRLHQSPCSVPGTRRMNATPLPVRSALAGHMITCWRKNVIATSSTAQVPSATRIWAIERWKSNATWPRTCSEMITAARCSRGSRIDGSSTGYEVPRICSRGPSGRGKAGRAHRLDPRIAQVWTARAGNCDGSGSRV